MKINREKWIFDVLYSKQAFLNNKNIASKTHKIGIFAKGLLHGFVKNWKFCERFVLCKIQPEKVFGDVLDKKKAFKDYKNNCVQKTKN